uniref:Uncharacterized protein n=1 Tax=Seriola dumerili TaxID=41447 RepID=A0A3B4VE92_SERDU
TLIQEQTNQLHTLQLQVDTHTSEQTSTQHTLSRTTQALSEARHETSRKERSLRILGKHLSGVQKERKQLEERLQRAEVELRDAARRKDHVISYMKAAEMSYKEVRESLIQSRHSLLAQPCPLLLPREHLELSGAESIMGDPEVAACQVNVFHSFITLLRLSLFERGGGGRMGRVGEKKERTHTHTQTQKDKPYVRGHTHTEEL